MQEREIWQGTVHSSLDGHFTFTGNISTTKHHQHYALQIFECTTPISILAGSTLHADVEAAVIGSMQTHAVLSEGYGTVTFVMPHSREGRALNRIVGSGSSAVAISDRAGGRPRRRLVERALARSIYATHQGKDSEMEKLDLLVCLRMDRIVESIRDCGPSRIELMSTASRLNMSESSLARFLRVEFGINFTAVVRWERLRTALTAMSQGKSCTDAAHHAGFYDGSHFTRVCRAMFGLSPTAIVITDRFPAKAVDPTISAGPLPPRPKALVV